MNNPLISIITVVYNGASTLERTIHSIIGQTYKNIEYIIIDGGSTDGTVDIIKKYENRLAFWVSEPDRGIYDAMNKGIDKATGEWMLFMGCDDILQNILHEIIPDFKKPNDIYYGNVYMTCSKIIYSGRFNSFKIAIKNICHQSVFYPKEVWSHYRYGLTYKVYADYELNMHLFVDKRFSFQYVEIVVAKYKEGGFASKNTDDFMKKGRYVILKNKYPRSVYLYAKMRYALHKIKQLFINKYLIHS
jgi:glycosyltransferase involved in cell wall biosynthesis